MRVMSAIHGRAYSVSHALFTLKVDELGEHAEDAETVEGRRIAGSYLIGVMGVGAKY